MNDALLFAEVIIPLALKGTFTYQVPEGEQERALPGMRVMVPFGQQKLYSGIISEVHQRVPEGFSPKHILSFPDDRCLVSEKQLQFWNWLSVYYMCTIGEVMNAALPGGLKLSSETVLQVDQAFSQYEILEEQERLVLEYLEGEGVVKLDDVRKGPFGNDGLRIVRALLEKRALATDQHVKKGYRPRKISCIAIGNAYGDEAVFGELLDGLARAKAQVKALEEFVRLSGQFDEHAEVREVERQQLIDEGVAPHAISALIKKGVFSVCERTISRIHYHTGADAEVQVPVSPLAAFQERAIAAVREKFGSLPAVLLHGITSSGKTEIYIHLIREQIEQGKQVLYLLPEIALTTQIISRLRRVFGEKVGIYHSRYSDNERVEVYRNLIGLTSGEPYDVILGVRSAIFLPFERLGLVIVDEEHENTYKQFDPAPRYHARDAATILGLFTGARVLMGSATPSFETLHNAMTGKYGMVELNRRYGDVALPEIIVADVTRARKRKQLKRHFTPELMNAMEEALGKGQQAILFQNRRGYSNYLHCNACGFILKCAQCDVSLTYHKYQHEMVCHYCGERQAVPVRCLACHAPELTMRGFGTEKIEDDIEALFPEVKVGRLDLDRSRSRKAFEKVISDFESGRTQVLVGTQMVTKGLDFGNVSLVGIVDADSMLNFPDFRAFERSYQLMVQVSGRAGRRKTRGKVIIQSADPQHPVIQRVLADDFRGFYDQQMEERRLFRYPPYVRLIRITLKHEIPSILDGGAVFLANELREVFGRRVLGPQQPMVGRTHGKYIKQIMLKIEKEVSVEKAKEIVAALLDTFSANPVYRQIRRAVDVDPQ
jgi:primosomal protein N' (replication factor Y) (superfamily II helicase)